MDMLANAAAFLQQHADATPPCSPKREEETANSTPPRQNNSGANRSKYINVFSTTTLTFEKVCIDYRIRFTTKSMQVLNSLNNEIIVARRFTCLRGPRNQMCETCASTRTGGSTVNKHCKSPYFVFFSPYLKSRYPKRHLSKSEAQTYMSFSFCIAKQKKA